VEDRPWRKGGNEQGPAFIQGKGLAQKRRTFVSKKRLRRTRVQELISSSQKKQAMGNASTND
jgi:hypothetical protein